MAEKLVVRCASCGAEYIVGTALCAECTGTDLETRYRDRFGPWLYGFGFVALAALSTCLILGSSTYENGWIVLAMGAGYAIWTWWYGVFYVYEWTLHRDGRLETRTLFRRRADTVADLKHDRDEDVNRWLLKRAGDRRRLRLSAASGEALADALRAGDASELIHDPQPPPPSPWWSRLLDVLLQGD